MNLLFLTEIAPFPPNGGEKLRSYGLLKLLSGLNLTVHAITGNRPINKSEQEFFPGIRFYPHDFHKRGSGSRLIRYFHRFSLEKELVTLINTILQNNTIDVAFIDYQFFGQYIGLFKKRKIPVIYGTHNAQAVLIYQNPALSLKNRMSRFTDYRVNRFHERYYFRKADACIVVSENDRKYHAGFINQDKIFVIPNFLIESNYACSSPVKDNYILMTANFKAFQNTYGLEWFIREVWNHELSDKTRLLLVGLGSKEIFNVLKEKYNFSNVSAFGEADDLKPFIEKARVSIVPLLHGSGSRLKCLEAMALKTQLVSTGKGAEGILHNNSILLADTPGDFRNELLRVIELKTDMTEKAYRAFMENYSLSPNMKVFANIIKTLVKKINEKHLL
jgi:glycosyltransferase involved in cell wall biosynthesis